MSEPSFEREVLDRLINIETKLNSYSDAKSKTYDNEKKIIKIENDVEEIQHHVTTLEETNKWLSRAIWGALITAGVGLLFAFVKMGAGI